MKPLWAVSLKISQADFDSWESQKPNGVPLLLWALESQRVNVDDYISWAKSNYKIPYLKDIAPIKSASQTLLEKWKGAFEEGVVPLFIWDEILFVGCVETLEGATFPMKHQWVLLEPAKIRQLRASLTVKSEQIIEGPIGLNIQLTGEVSPPPLAIDDKATQVLDAPIGLNFDALTQSLVMPTDISSLQFNIGEAPQPPPIDSKKTTVAATPPPLEAVSPAPEILAPPPLSARPAPQNISMPPPPLEATQSQYNQNGMLDGIAQNAVRHFKRYFQKSMLFKFSDKGLEPWKWTDGWNEDPTKSPYIDLSIPSIFRIVTESKMPYHGYVVTNNINASFFEKWNRSVIPEHVTILPLKAHQQMTGVIMGVTDKDTGYRLDLNTLESEAEKISQQLLHTKHTAAA